MIEVKNISKKYGSKLALDNINFSLKDGEILGFLGPNGAGKSTTMNIITGYISSTTGTVMVDKDEIMENPINVKKKIGYLPEQPPLYQDMTVKEYLSFMYDLKKVKLNKKEHIEYICNLVKISNVYDRLIKNLSKGYKQRVGLAQALLGDPEVLILDEPTVGLDPNQIIEIRSLIKSLGEKHTIILSSHILSEIQSVCSRIIVIDKGKIVADDTASNLSSSLSMDSRLLISIEGEPNDVIESLNNIEGVKTAVLGEQKDENTFEYIVTYDKNIDVRKNVFSVMAQKECPIVSMNNVDMSLEDIFLRLTQGDEEVVEESVKDEMPDADKVSEEKNNKILEQKENLDKEQKDGSEE